MKEEDKEIQSKKEGNNSKLLGKEHQIDSSTKDYGQSKNKKSRLLISQEISNDISDPTVIFNYKDKLIYIRCTKSDNMRNICERFAFEIKENINNLCFKINDNIINEKLKYEELVDNGCKNINIKVEEINKRDNSGNKNYIIAEINVKEDDLNKNLRIINSSKSIKVYHMLDYYKYNNEEEIKNCKIEINDKTIPFNYFIIFKETGTFKIKYTFKDNISKTSYMFYKCNSLTNIDLSNFNTKNVTDMRTRIPTFMLL